MSETGLSTASAGTDTKSARRRELARFLRAHREQVGPDAVGLPHGVRRRTPGLRREEVAQLAGVGVTWYTWLEQGRPINASIQVLDAVARVLQLGSAERWHLYRLARVPGVPMPPAMPETLPPDAVHVLDRLDPSPACIYNGRYDLIANNSSYAAIFPWVVTASGMERNVLWRVAVAGEDVRPINPDLFGRMVANLRQRYADHIGDATWEALIERLSGSSALFREAWARQEIRPPGPQHKQFRCPPVGTIRLNTLSYAIDGAAELRMIVHLPESSTDAERLQELLRIGGVRLD
ncbi:helix-turn-helix domain-containing protein [Allobranchiibius huperziae]|uniref:Transcriptional regulator with XRE-family HTH domain n=1 Tax=Allobranchiibius huperziae TaxID=1874116 RepID=A0A853DF23_9MICO|nr:transcriptional regulator with XRE-family HTH domain [Allobranchiibius huperziae]